MPDQDLPGWRESILPASRCPYCLAPHDRAASFEDATPGPGDYTVCAECAQLLVFRDDMSLRATTPAEIKQIEESDPDLAVAVRRMQRMLRSIGRRE